MNFTLPELGYGYNELEPIIDAKTMEIHHSKHHNAYVTNLNAALAKHPEVNYPTLEELLLNIDKLPSDIQEAVKNNGGGHYNHLMFWKFLTPDMSQTPTGKLLKKLEDDFTSYEMFKTEFTEKGKKLFGSGWVWLILNKNNKLEVITTPNQDVPLAKGTPLLCVDVWEHAYYLKHQNRRPDYLNTIWEVINWRFVEKLFAEAIEK